MRLRQSAVAGQFYSGSQQGLVREVEGFLREDCPRVKALGIISPHAGYMYSGRFAGEVFSSVEVPAVVIVLGPNHHGLGSTVALSACEGWLTPMGSVTIDKEMANELARSCALFEFDDVAHRQEHSLEVQVPFVQACNPKTAIVPICLQFTPLPNLLAIGESIANVIRRSPGPVLMVASSDMTHYESAQTARLKDNLAIERVLALDPEGLFHVVRENRISMCGVLPSVVMLAAACSLGAGKAELIAYGHSGEVTGDLDRVVAYAGIRVV